MLNGRTVVVVVPAFQEEAHVGRVIETMPAFVDAIILVDDCSTDATSSVARSVGDTRLRIVRHSKRSGVGASIASGYDAAREIARESRDAIAVMAGDGQMSPDDLEKVVRPIVEGTADYVKGNRFDFPGVRRAMGWPRWIGGQVFSWLTALAVGQPISDSQCGYTAIAGGFLARIDTSQMWQSFGYPNDLLGIVGARAGRIREVPVLPVYGNETSKLRLRHLPPIFFLIGRAAVRRMYSNRTTVTEEACGSNETYHPEEKGCEHPVRDRRAGASRR
jgi:glycosyltransferase involved in cell wall biosynthesis